jgi:hypothetical protein
MGNEGGADGSDDDDGLGVGRRVGGTAAGGRKELFSPRREWKKTDLPLLVPLLRSY